MLQKTCYSPGSCVTYKKNKILVITSTFPRWEGDTDPPFVFELCRRINRALEVIVLCPHYPGTKSRERVQDITVARFRYFPEKWEKLAYDGGILNKIRQSRWYYLAVPFFILGELMATVQLLRKEDIALINAHWLIPQGLIALIARYCTRSSAALVCTLHGGDIFALNSRIATALKRFVLKRSTAVLAVSTAMQETVISLGAARSRVHVIPMGVDLHHSFVPSNREKKKKSLLFVGRFVEKKGLPYLIEAMPLVLQKHPDAHLIIAGHGPDEVALTEQIASLKLRDTVTCIGAVENTKLPGIYQAAEIVIFPSIIDSRGDTEGFGLVMVEALGCECAVIASDLPAIHDTIRDNETGIIVEQKNIRKLADKIIHLLDNPGMRQRLGRQGRNYVLERYDWEITAEKYCGVFREVIARQKN